MISSYGDQLNLRIILHIIITTTNAASIALNASRDALCSIHAITTSELALIEMVLLSIFFLHESDPHGDPSADCSFIHFVAPCACSSSSG